MKRAFLDTGYLIALELSEDQHHIAAKEHWREYLKANPVLVTTTYIFDEITTFFNSRDRHLKAVEIGNILLESPTIHLIHVDKDLFENGWKIFQQYNDKPFSLTDCISFTVMRKEEIFEALSFDHHFEQAGFRRLPEF